MYNFGGYRVKSHRGTHFQLLKKRLFAGKETVQTLQDQHKTSFRWFKRVSEQLRFILYWQIGYVDKAIDLYIKAVCGSYQHGVRGLG
jgi:hypothetical protein